MPITVPLDKHPLYSMDDTETIKVLIADDHRMLAQSLARVLDDEADIEVVHTVGTAAQAVTGVEKFEPDIVLMDYMLPDGNGVEAARAIREVRPKTRVILITGFPDDRLLLDAIEAGCFGCVTKDRAIEDVVSAVRQVAAGEALLSTETLQRLLPRLRRDRRGLGSDLSPREIEVLEMLAEGASNAAIAERLVLSIHTVRNHVQSVISKLQAHSKLEAVANAIREGIVRYP